MSERKPRGGRRSREGVASTLRDLVESVAARVVARVQRDLPDREQIRLLERQLRRLERRLESADVRSVGGRVGRPRLDRKCKMPTCGLPHVAQGFCSKHYQAWRRRTMRARSASS